MNIKTVTTVDGINSVDFGNTTDKYYWCKNIGDTTVYVSTNPNVEAGADGVAELAAGDVVMLENYQSIIYVLGAGKVEIHEQNFADCSFKSVKKGGDSSIIYGNTISFDSVHNLDISDIGVITEE